MLSSALQLLHLWMDSVTGWVSVFCTLTLRRDWSWQSAAPPLSPAYFKSHLKIPHTPSNNILTRYSEFQSIDNQFGGLPSWARGRIALNNYTFCSIQILQTIFVCDPLCLCVCSFHCHWPREIWSGELFAGVSVCQVWPCRPSLLTQFLLPLTRLWPGAWLASIVHCKLSQSEARIQVTWSLSTNQRPVLSIANCILGNEMSSRLDSQTQQCLYKKDSQLLTKSDRNHWHQNLKHHKMKSEEKSISLSVWYLNV